MNAILATYDLGDALLTTLAIFFMVIWIWILITVMIDLFRDRDLSGWWKAVWVFGLIFLPFLSVFIYLIARGNGMRDRAIEQQREMQQATDAYIRQTAGGASAADEIAKLDELRKSGAIDDAEYQSLKAKVLA
jgi:ABC-type multidrug transport system fused ATPase/permease subunit